MENQTDDNARNNIDAPEKAPAENQPAGKTGATGQQPPQKGEKPAAKTAKKPNGTKKKRDLKTWLAVVVGAAILVAAALAVFDVEDLTKTYVEKLASRTLTVPVHIADLTLNPKEKQILVEGIHVGNPEGFDKPAALVVGSALIEVESFDPQHLVINRIHVEYPEIALEVKNNRTNLTVIRDNMNRYAAAEIETNGNDEARQPPIGVIINALSIDTASLYMSLNGTDMKPLPIPPLEITGIGTAQGAVLSSQAIGQILDHVTRHAIAHAAQAGYLQDALSDSALNEIKRSLRLDYKGQAQEKLEKLGDEIKGFIEEHTR